MSEQTTFTVKDFPSDIRLKIRAEAALRDITNAQMLTIICNHWFEHSQLSRLGKQEK